MAFSANQQQLAAWGERFGVAPPRDASELPHRSLSFWVAANDRAIAWGRERMPDRFLVLRYEELCRDPAGGIDRLCEFVGHHPDPETLERMRAIPQPGAGIGRWRSHEPGALDPGDLSAVERLGYEI